MTEHRNTDSHHGFTIDQTPEGVRLTAGSASAEFARLDPEHMARPDDFPSYSGEPHTPAGVKIVFTSKLAINPMTGRTVTDGAGVYTVTEGTSKAFLLLASQDYTITRRFREWITCQRCGESLYRMGINYDGALSTNMQVSADGRKCYGPDEVHPEHCPSYWADELDIAPLAPQSGA